MNNYFSDPTDLIYILNWIHNYHLVDNYFLEDTVYLEFQFDSFVTYFLAIHQKSMHRDPTISFIIIVHPIFNEIIHLTILCFYI